jgi:NhaP-type Na+/H+ or K+/H+ antiporter
MVYVSTLFGGAGAAKFVAKRMLEGSTTEKVDPIYGSHGPAVGIFFGFLCITVGLLFTWVMAKSSFKKYVNLPYTVIVFFFGVVISMYALYAENQDSALVVSTRVWMNIDPDLMLYALLPPLLFCEAMKLDSHQVRLAFLPASLLALPGAAFGAYMQALVCFYMLPKYEWSWLFCFMVGAVLSATDPVSVVGMLKSVRGGTTSTAKLTYLITGESLLNDGAALTIFEAIVSKHYDDEMSVVMFFVRVLLISPLIGIGIGLLTLEVLKKARRRLSIEHNTVQIAVTISCAYMSFFLAQYLLGVSGIISCCAAGILLAWLAPSLILQPEQHEIIWHMMEWVGNTMIFTIAGLIVGKYSGIVEWNDVWCILIIYITMTLIRALMLSICYPVVSWFHEEYSFKDIIFSTFGGLRGAISLALVLIIEKHLDDFSEVKDEHMRCCYSYYCIQWVILWIFLYMAIQFSSRE